MTDPNRAAYIHAAGVRLKEERTKIPELYEQAAAEFDALGYVLVAARCRERAAFYRQYYGIGRYVIDRFGCVVISNQEPANDPAD